MVTKWQYNTPIKHDDKIYKLSYNIDKENKQATYKIKGYIKTININPLLAYDDIVMDISEWIIEKY